jgi:beta-phosphoglucomutase-like phosphatase (HAD superfamily)
VVRRLGVEWPLGIASGALRRDIELMLKGAGLSDAFRFIVSAEDTDESKPAPAPYLLAAERHGVPAAACVAIEDSQWGLQSARAAGMRTIAVTTNYRRAELAPHADRVVAALGEVTLELVRELAPDGGNGTLPAPPGGGEGR